jgi:type I restriction enzyme, R subunit
MNIIEIDEQYNIVDPILRQLISLGWKTIRGDEFDATVSLRSGFNEVIIEKELRAALARMYPWLQEDQVNDIIRAVTFARIKQLPEANEELFHLFQRTISVAENRKTGERNPSISFIDFQNPANNSCIAIARYKLQIPGTAMHIVPDIVLFINGFPFVIIDCKSSYYGDPITQAIEELRQFSNQTGNKNGNEFLFHYNQILIVTDGITAKYGTITSQHEDFCEWKDPYPQELPEDPNQQPSSLQSLVAGMLSEPNLLEIIRSYIVFKVNEKGKLVKFLARYPQFRALQKMARRIKTATSQVHKGGIIYHTHGSGKSTAMFFAARKIYRDPELQKYKVVLVTGKKSIEHLLDKSTLSAGYTLRKAATINELQELLKADSPDLVLCMMPNYQERELLQEFPVLNESSHIIIMIHEAHRSRYKWMSAHLTKALPNAIKIIFTGSPLEPFQADYDPYIDKYSMKNAIKDGLILNVNYESRIEVVDEFNLGAKDKPYKEFKDVIIFQADDDKKRVGGDRSSRRQYQESQEVIRDKAGDILKHYISQVFPNKFKAQIVTSSHFAAVRYKQELDRALYDIINQFNVNPNPYIDLAQLKKLKIAVIITKSVQDPPAYRPFTDEREHIKNIDSFLLSFGCFCWDSKHPWNRFCTSIRL